MGALVDVRDAAEVRILTLQRPERLNALDLALSCAFRDAVLTALATPAVRVLIVSGQGGNFCAGADMKRDRRQEAASGLDILEVMQEAVGLLRGGRLPTVAAIEGNAAGAGLSIALACDFLVASRTSRLSAAFTSVGLVPDLGITAALPERVGIGVARDLLLAGGVRNGDQALADGLVDDVCEPGAVLDAALARARRIAEAAPLALAGTRRLLAERGLPSSSHAQLELLLQRAMRGSADATEAAAAFADKRRPVFRGA